MGGATPRTGSRPAMSRGGHAEPYAGGPAELGPLAGRDSALRQEPPRREVEHPDAPRRAVVRQHAHRAGIEDEVLPEPWIQPEVGGGEHTQRVSVTEERDVALLEVGPYLVDDLLRAG